MVELRKVGSDPYSTEAWRFGGAAPSKAVRDDVDVEALVIESDRRTRAAVVIGAPTSARLSDATPRGTNALSARLSGVGSGARARAQRWAQALSAPRAQRNLIIAACLGSLAGCSTMPGTHLGAALGTFQLDPSARVNQAFGSALMPTVPLAVRVARADAAVRYEKGGTSLFYMAPGSAADVKTHLGGYRDAAGMLVTANVPMFTVRYSYGTGHPMDVWALQAPPGGILELQGTSIPSWHANAAGDSAAAAALVAAMAATPNATLTAAQVAAAFRASPSFAAEIQLELGDIDAVARDFVVDLAAQLSTGSKNGDSAVQAAAAKLVSSTGQRAMGEKFSKENIYSYDLVAVKNGAVVASGDFDVDGNSPPQPGRRATSRHATPSPVVRVDVSKYPGTDFHFRVWPKATSSGGYAERREAVIHPAP